LARRRYYHYKEHPEEKPDDYVPTLEELKKMRDTLDD